MGYIGGALQEQFAERVRGVDPGRLLAVPIDVGKDSAAAMVCDFYGEVLTEPFTFPLTEPGVDAFTVAVARAEAARGGELPPLPWRHGPPVAKWAWVRRCRGYLR